MMGRRFYPMSLERVWKERINFISEILFKWLRKGKDISKIKKPMSFRACSDIESRELNRFMSDLLRFLFMEEFGGKKVNLIEDIKYTIDIFKSLHLTTLLTKKIQDLLEKYPSLIEDYSEGTKKRINQMMKRLENKEVI